LTESAGPTVASGVAGRQNVCESCWCFVIALTGAGVAAHGDPEPGLRLQAPSRFGPALTCNVDRPSGTIFEAAYAKRAGEGDVFWELFDHIWDALEVNPRSIGEQHTGFDGTCWVYESPSISRLPRLYVLYQISDGAGLVWLWNFHFRLPLAATAPLTAV
jgi:hypothetical protein